MPRISQLPSLSAADNADELAIVDVSASTTKKITRGDLLKAPLPANSVTTAAIANDAVETAKIKNGAVTPEKRTGGFKVGVIPSSTISTTGVKSITGLGFSPKLVRFTVLYPASSSAASFSTGSMTSSGQFFVASTGNSRLSGSDAVVVVIPAGSTSRSLNVEYSSMNADGFSIDVKTALGLEVAYEAYA